MNYLPRYKVALIKEGHCPSSIRTITSPADAFTILHTELGQADREIFLAVLLDTRNRIIGLHQISIGTLNSSLVHPRETFKAALLCNCAGLILAHSHPSGDLDPSKEDLAVTARLKQAGELLGIPVFDHLIIGDDAFISLKERGLC